MELSPDRRHYTKQWMTLGTLTILLAMAGGITTAVMAIVGTETNQPVIVLWIVLGSVSLATWVIGAPIIYWWIRNLRYRIEPDKVIINKGILTKTEQNIPLRMVTDFRLQRTLYDRWLGIGSILVQTAGQTQTATGYEGKLAGLAEWGELHGRLQGLVLEFDQRPTLGAPSTPLSASPGEDLHELAEDVHAIRRYLERVGS